LSHSNPFSLLGNASIKLFKSQVFFGMVVLGSQRVSIENKGFFGSRVRKWLKIAVLDIRTRTSDWKQKKKSPFQTTCV